MIRLFNHTETNFTHNGVHVLDDIVIGDTCILNNEINGVYSLECEVAMFNNSKWKDIESEIEELKAHLEELEQDDESDTLMRYKKAIPKLQDCLLEYDKMSISQKNESLKSIIERITYSKSKRLNWRRDDEDDMAIHIEMKI